MFFGLLLALLLNSVAAFLIRSYVHPSATCNTTAGVACFAELYQMMEETCSHEELSFRCVHYTFLDECFEARVGKCKANLVGQFANAGLKTAVASCGSPKKTYKQSEGAIQLVGKPRETMNPIHLVNSLGYLQVQCSLSRYKNCSSDHVHNIISQCEEHMKPKSGYINFDRHRLLRIKLDTSKKLMYYEETDKERECLVVRSIFSELYSLHQTHCYHSIVTRCLCERMQFNTLCSIDCSHLEATAPNQNELAWDEWKRARLIRSSAPRDFHAVFLSILLLICL